MYSSCLIVALHACKVDVDVKEAAQLPSSAEVCKEWRRPTNGRGMQLHFRLSLNPLSKNTKIIVKSWR